ncbi:MAG: NADP-specific glutamate dehydrogenase [Planctomycetes bacterium]|nr:NADP-specific glutamate dehydrogenase [Planctomycetota bacterium]
MEKKLQPVFDKVQRKNEGEPEFLQAVSELFHSLGKVYRKNEELFRDNVLERILEPERVLMFRVPWMDDSGKVQVNRGFRVEHSSALGPYKGGLRFHPSVNLSMMKFLAFEQTFKNALTALPLGGGKGGSDFDPKGKSDAEVMRFCQSFMNELFRHIGDQTDVPAGDIGVGVREIGFLFGQYKKIANRFAGALTGKGLLYGGSELRLEATGYGLIYFAAYMLARKGKSFEGKRVSISGSGNVAQFACEKAAALGARVVALSDSGGHIEDDEGIDLAKLEFVKHLKNEKRGRIFEYVERFKGSRYIAGNEIWKIPVDVAMPCATQNELDDLDAAALLENGCICIAEGANMPSTPAAISKFLDAGILFAPAKAANAGGVAVSGLEMSQNAMRASWTRHEVDARLRAIMNRIHQTCIETAEQFGVPGNYQAGANIASFRMVATAMLQQGVV